LPRRATEPHPACAGCPFRREGRARQLPPHCARTGRYLISHAWADYCADPDGPRFGAATPPPGWDVAPGHKPPAEPDRHTEVARSLWGQLHRVALRATDAAAFARYVRESFTPRVACGGCRIRWKGIVARMPPEDAADPFAWSVDAHNAVNIELDPPKPVVSLEEARRLHEPTKGAEGADRRAVEAPSIDN
jgi:hypothetical protein